MLTILLTKTSSNTNTSQNASTLRWNPIGITIAGKTGIAGNNATLLNQPYSLAFDSSNALYIVDYLNSRVQKLTPGTVDCVTVAGEPSGVPGSAASDLFQPAGLFIDSNDDMYISDRSNNRIQLWVKGTSSGITIAGIGGILNISLSGPTTIVKDNIAGSLFISDTYHHRIIDYPSGKIVAGGNPPGITNMQLNFPYGLTYDSIEKSLVIPNYGTNEVVRWVIGDSNWTHIAGDINGNAGNSPTMFNSPVGVTMDPMGNLYVADAANHRIQFFLAGQNNGTTIAGVTGIPGTSSIYLNSPYGVLLDSQLNLYVSDTFNHRIQKFLRY